MTCDLLNNSSLSKLVVYDYQSSAKCQALFIRNSFWYCIQTKTTIAFIWGEHRKLSTRG